MARSQRLAKVVYLDGQALARTRDGIGSYTANILHELLLHNPNNIQYRAILFRDQRRTKKLIEPTGNFNYIYLPLPRRLYAALFRIIRVPVDYWLPTRPNVMWYPNFVTFPWVSRARRIVTIHDLTYLHFPEMVSQRNLTYLQRFVPFSIQQAAHILTPSNAIAAELRDTFGATAPITSIAPPVAIDTKQSKPSLNKPLPEQYCLAVGTIEPRKNIEGLLESYLALPKDLRTSFPLVIAGRLGWLSARTKELFLKAVEDEKVIWCDGPTDKELSYLYQHARVLIFMSHYEGYGMPLAEAQLVNLPIIALDTPINRETAGQKAHYAHDIADATRLLTKCLETAERKRTQIDSHSTKLDINSLMDALGV